jgi:5-methylcytosine-specific restriction enzyme subunit McrC
MSKILLRFYEHERVFFEDSYKNVAYEGAPRFSFTKPYIEAISIFHQRGGNQYYSLEHEGLKFKHFVGAIQIQDLTIEVLPKIDRPGQGKLINKAGWHDLLIDMLKACKQIKPKSNQRASLKLKSNSILELYIELLVNEMEFLLRTGLMKQYRRQQGNINALKGRLLFAKQIQHNLVHQERFYTDHSIYDTNSLLHQILRQALNICKRLSSSGLVKDRICRLLLHWPESKQVNIDEKIFKKFSRNRKFVSYTEALLIAKMFLLNYRPDIKGGNVDMIALMFNMNSLWEEFIYQRFKSLEEVLDLRVYKQNVVDFWFSDTINKTVRPDLIITYNNKTLVVDTKWKCPEDDIPADDDLKQMLVYKLYFHADNACLLYPEISESYGAEGFFNEKVHHTVRVNGVKALKDALDYNCGMVFLNLHKGGALISEEHFKFEILPILKLI